jgi:hypothetical protein
MKFGASRSQLYDAQKTLRARWDSVGEIWSDQTKVDFEEQIWGPLDRNTSEVLRAVDQVSALFGQIRNECQFGG